jgi:hypothetical protein
MKNTNFYYLTMLFSGVIAGVCIIFLIQILGANTGLIFTAPFETILNNYQTLEPQISCAGIENYILEDWDSTLSALKTKGQFLNYDNSESSVIPQPPQNMGSIYYDCEDLSHAILCASRYFNFECKAYYSFTLKSEPKAHIGVECYYPNGGWYEVF